MCDINCPTIAVQVHTIFWLLISFELFETELALNPFDAVFWPGTQGPYIQVADETFNYTATGKVWSNKAI
jgi:hypothetical protein